MKGAASLILESYYPLLKLHFNDIKNVGITYPIPQFRLETLHLLAVEAIEVLKTHSALISCESDVVVVGDIHGNIHDLLRILTLNRTPPLTHYIFLGDYVDRGTYSIEVVTLLLAFLIRWPESIILLRGNHEVAHVNENYGFKEQIIEMYNDETLWKAFNNVFNFLPIGVILKQKYFCVHGGISPNLNCALDLVSLELPISNTKGLVDELLWSDPTEFHCTFLENKRGYGYIFGSLSTKKFLANSNLIKIIRGHQCVQFGIEQLHKGRVFTVFSSSNYDKPFHLCGYLLINDEGIIDKNLSYLKPVQHCEACFENIKAIESDRKSMAVMMFLHNATKIYVRPRSRTIKPVQSSFFKPVIPITCQSTNAKTKP